MLNDLPSLEGRSESRAFTDTDDTRLGRAIAPLEAAHPGSSGIWPLADAHDAFAARALLARSAERSIDAQYYIWRKDITGTLLFNELRAAADRGVRVRLLLDDNTTSGLDETIAALHAHPNIEVRLFNPFVNRSHRWLGFATDFFRLNRRMHNKSFTVDNQATIIGGRNIGDEYFGTGDGGLFVDLDVLAVGDVAHDVSDDFDRYWKSASSYPADRILPEVPQARLEELAALSAKLENSAMAREYVEAVQALPIVEQIAGQALPFLWVPVRMVSDDPAKALGKAGPGGLLITELDHLLDRPKHRLGLVSGYFVPTGAGVRAFSALARRGVAVDIVANALEATDVPIAHAGYVGDRKPLLEAGVRLWEIRRQGGPPPSRGIMGSGGSSGSGGSGSAISGSRTALHAKTFTIDSERIFIGSFNFDPRSAELNTELGFVIDSPELARLVDDAIARRVPSFAYELRLSEKGKVYWIERHDGEVIRHDKEPGTGFWQRNGIRALSYLPIEWLL